MIYLDNKHGNVTIYMQYMWPITPPFSLLLPFYLPFYSLSHLLTPPHYGMLMPVHGISESWDFATYFEILGEYSRLICYLLQWVYLYFWDCIFIFSWQMYFYWYDVFVSVWWILVIVYFNTCTYILFVILFYYCVWLTFHGHLPSGAAFGLSLAFGCSPRALFSLQT